jgi:acyl-[acyl-carrier-protein]-phospholipid O-acyltransferase/long-chain-fatty-acid--[acyl-carrier-protein] ligase
MTNPSVTLKERSGVFSIYLVVLFINAFVDLGHKITIQNTIFKIYDEQTQIILTTLVNGLVLLPFVLFFTLSGYLSDRFAKPTIMRWSAFAAVLITLGITYSYYQGEYVLAFGFTLLIAIQSAIYSPAKYGYIKECLGKKGLSVGNAYVMAITLTSILLGTVFFSYLFESYLDSQQYSTPEDIVLLVAPVGWLLVAMSVFEWLATFGIRFYENKFSTAALSIRKIVTGHYFRKNIHKLQDNKVTWYSILGTAMFWAISQNLIAVFPAHAKVNLGIDSPLLVQAMLALSIVGIMIGAYLSGRKSQNAIKVNNIYIGSTLIVIASTLLPLLSLSDVLTSNYVEIGMGEPVKLILLMVASDIFLFGLGAGMSIVPFNALIQDNTELDKLGSVLAGKNWLQNSLMLVFLMITASVASLNVNSEYILYLNAAIAVVGFSSVLIKLKSSYK